MDACYKDREVDWKMTSRGIWYFRDGKSVVISFSHPEARVKDAYLFYALTDEFAILRIGYRGYGEEGTLNADEKFAQNMENARKAGIDVGVYFFSQAVNEEEAKEEADFVLEHLKGQELQMPVVYDPEHILEDEARTDDVTGEQFTQNAKVFCKEIEEAGYDAMIYSNMLWEAYELDLEKLLDYPVWYADYEELPQTPYRFSMWQYSSTGSVAGIEGNVDLNIQLLKK